MFERLQFAFPDYDLATLPSIPETWQDTSWCNDCCPSFALPNGLEVWIDYRDVTLREFGHLEPTAARFSVLRRTDDVEQLFWSDDWQDVLNFVESYA